MPRLLSRLLLLCLVCLALICLALHPTHADNELFQPTPAAKASIDFDGRGFLIGGKRTFVVAGALHYSRVPRALWRDRLLRIKRAGYNTVQTYAFWSYHETREGQYDFSGDKDLDAYLKLIHSMGMYAIVRIGPYVNAEWSGGGWPVWLRFKPGVIVRDNDKPFLTVMDHWLDHLMPIVTANQVTRGGSVIMVQLENEDPRGGGTDLTNPYFVHLRNKALALGMVVPHFFSGLNHSDNPAQGGPLDLTNRHSPWYSTEFWTGWINVYGSEPGKADHLERATWRVLANGGAGYTHYTMAGGTNFDGWNCDEQGTNYDFGAPIGQAGDNRDVYYRLKRAATFGTSFSDILADSKNVGDQYANVAQGVPVTARQSPAGTIVFLNNADGGGPVKTQVKGPDGILYPTSGPLTLAPGEVVPIVENYALAPGVRLDLAAGRILGINRQELITTLVVYGPPGDPVEVRLSAPAVPGKRKAAQSTIKAICPVSNDAFQASLFYAGDQAIRVLVMNDHLADRTWFVYAGGRLPIVIGPDYVGDVTVRGDHLVLQTERRGIGLPSPKVSMILDADPPIPLRPDAPFHTLPFGSRVPALTTWSVAPGAPEAQAGYLDTDWKAGANPLPMGADGDQSAYAWYRAVVKAPHAGTYGLSLADAGDWVSAFVNGVHTDSSTVQQRRDSPVARNLKVTLKSGPNVLALLAAHYGRSKLHAYIGPLDEIDKKGTSGTVSLGATPTPPVDINKFRWQADDQGIADASVKAAPDLDTGGGDWHDATTATDVFNGRLGSAWFRTTLPDVPGPHRRIHFGSIDDNGQIFLNGKQVASNIGVNAGADVALDSAWKEGGPNLLAISVQNTAGGGGMNGTVTLQGDLTGSQDLHGWKMHGGVRLPVEAAWRPMGKTVPVQDGACRFYRAAFTYKPALPDGPHPVLRVRPAGLSRGFVWLNGHNLGRYPERSDVDGLYLPECWMAAGRNTLVFFDEDGLPPTQAALTEEKIASRDNVALTTGR